MEEVKKKILVLGSTGMLGHVLIEKLCRSNKYQIFNISRKKLDDQTILVDVTNYKILKETIYDLSPNYIINCVGILVEDSKLNPAQAIKINSLLPHQLKEIADNLNASLIHISTDCVFDGSVGNYSEDSKTSATDIYGKTKILGEINGPNHTNIRTSIIGPELFNNSRGLLSWILENQDSNYIEGYSKSIWSGITTIELSKAIIYCIENSIFGLLHISNKPISKYELISLIVDKFNLNIKVKKVDGNISDKSLITRRNDFNYNIPSYKQMISDMKSFIELKKYLY